MSQQTRKTLLSVLAVCGLVCALIGPRSFANFGPDPSGPTAEQSTVAGSTVASSQQKLRKPSMSDTIKASVYADNTFELYINGQLAAVDSIQFIPHNVISVDILPAYPMTIAVLAKDNADPDTGMEYANTNIGDAGFILKFGDEPLRMDHGRQKHSLTALSTATQRVPAFALKSFLTTGTQRILMIVPGKTPLNIHNRMWIRSSRSLNTILTAPRLSGPTTSPSITRSCLGTVLNPHPMEKHAWTSGISTMLFLKILRGVVAEEIEESSEYVLFCSSPKSLSMKLITVCLCFCVFAGLQLPTLSAHDGAESHDHDEIAERKWTFAETGTTFSGQFVSAKDGRVRIRRPDGWVRPIEIGLLSDSDQQWIAARMQIIENINTVAILTSQQSDQRAARLPNRPRSTPDVSKDEHLSLLQKSFEPFQATVKTRSDEEFFYVESNGVPDHQMMVGITAWQQQCLCHRSIREAMHGRFLEHRFPPKNPLSAKTNFFRGAIAIAVNGIPIFNPIKNDGRTDTFTAGELDNWGGHCGRGDDYHYHIAPVHLQKQTGRMRRSPGLWMAIRLWVSG